MAQIDTDLTDRAQHLLKLLVEHHIQSGQPVGSRTLVKSSGLNLSAATIRNVMADLEDMGFVDSPHTSAGRIPTVKGYRFFIDTLLRVQPISNSFINQLRVRFGSDQQPQKLVTQASDILSTITHMASIVTTPRSEHAILRQIEFLALSENRVLVILVTNRHEVQNRVIDLDRPFGQDELQEAANYINAHFSGQDLRGTRRKILGELDKVRQDMDRIMRSAIELADKALPDDSEGEMDDSFIVAGHIQLMEYQELSDLEKLKQLFHAFSQKREMLSILDKCIYAQGVQIFIGHESGFKVLDDCSVVTAPYTIDGERTGVLGVIGPTRMAYDRVIPIVDVTAKLLGAALNGRLPPP